MRLYAIISQRVQSLGNGGFAGFANH